MLDKYDLNDIIRSCWEGHYASDVLLSILENIEYPVTDITINYSELENIFDENEIKEDIIFNLECYKNIICDNNDVILNITDIEKKCFFKYYLEWLGYHIDINNDNIFIEDIAYFVASLLNFDYPYANIKIDNYLDVIKIINDYIVDNRKEIRKKIYYEVIDYIEHNTKICINDEITYYDCL